MICPHCHEKIKDNAKKCKFCLEFIEKIDKEKIKKDSNFKNKIINFKLKNKIYLFFNYNWKIWRKKFIIYFILINIISWIIWKMLEFIWINTLEWSLFYSIISSFFVIVYLWIIILSIIKRLNDLNINKWYILLLIIPIINFMLIIALLFKKGVILNDNEININKI